jgi:hypothetical protein
MGGTIPPLNGQKYAIFVILTRKFNKMMICPPLNFIPGGNTGNTHYLEEVPDLRS